MTWYGSHIQNVIFLFISLIKQYYKLGFSYSVQMIYQDPRSSRICQLASQPYLLPGTNTIVWFNMTQHDAQPAQFAWQGCH